MGGGEGCLSGLVDPSPSPYAKIHLGRNRRKSENFIFYFYKNINSMAYRKKTYKRTYKKRTYKKPLKSMVRSMILKSQETKELTYPYTNVGGTNLTSIGYGSTSAVVGFFGAVAQGVNDGQRIGNSLYARGIYMNLALQNANATLEYYNNVRCIVFQPRKGMATNIQPSSTATFVQSVLSGQVSSITQWAGFVDTDRFQVLYDKTWYIPSVPQDGASTSTQPTTRFIRKFIKVNRKMQWDDSGIINNDVYMILLSDSSSSPNPGCIAGNIRIYYKDA